MRLAHQFVLGGLLAIALLGCNSQHPFDIPANARLAADGAHAAATADQTGKAFVYDQTAHRLIWSGSVGAGQDVSADPVADDITVDSTPVVTGSLNSRHRYQIWFEPAAAR